MDVQYEINQASINAWGNRYTDNRRLAINIRYTFGFGQKHDKGNMFEMEEYAVLLFKILNFYSNTEITSHDTVCRCAKFGNIIYCKTRL